MSRPLSQIAKVALGAMSLTALAVTTTPTISSAATSPAPATVNFVLKSFDGTPINAHFFPATGLKPGQRAPVILLAHGFGETGPSQRNGARLAGAPTVSALVNGGFDVLTWDARGMGNSGGTSRTDSPDAEVRDVEALITWAAKRPDVMLDKPGDPRVGMTGASYGGIIQYLAAAADPRIDAIAPAYTAYSLPNTSLSLNGKFKEGWGVLLGGIDVSTIPAGLGSSAGPQLHGIDPPLIPGLIGSTASGTLTPGFRSYLQYRSPSRVLSKIHIPTLVIGGTSDTLFTLTNAVSDYTYLKRHHVPTEMMWNCEGHSVCPGKTGALEQRFNNTQVRWFQHWLLRKKGVSTGPGFQWIADNESSYRTAPTYPLPVKSHLVGHGHGSLVLTPAGPLTGISLPLLGGKPASYSFKVSIKAPRTAGNVIGFPQLKLTYSGTGAPSRTWVYAQIVDQVENRVVNAQVTPIPVTLDGKTHQLTISLNAISSRATSTSRYQLQLMPGSLIYGLQKSAGLISFASASISLPVS